MKNSKTLHDLIFNTILFYGGANLLCAFHIYKHTSDLQKLLIDSKLRALLIENKPLDKIIENDKI